MAWNGDILRKVTGVRPADYGAISFDEVLEKLREMNA